MNKQKKFGLVFEEHLPESVKLFDIPVKRNAVVMEKSGGAAVYKVISVKDGVAECLDRSSQETKNFNVEDLVVIAEFGTPIYPYLKPIDSICNAPDSDLWHTLIEADNYHALQLLEYLYAGKVDCIYIDPPYNTGARDWKYNNDYVDGADEYRHSKWLSFMQRRLALAKKLLNPKDSVLIVTIDEKEYLHLGCLLEQMFPDAKIQMITSVINPSGAGGKNDFSRVDEYIFFVMFGDVIINKQPSDMLFNITGKKNSRVIDGLSWETFVRGGQANNRNARRNLCYPVLIDEDNLQIIGCLPPLEGDSPETPKYINGKRAIYPFKTNGSLGIWRLEAASLMPLVEKGYAYVSSYDAKNDRYAVKYLLSGTIERIESGEIQVIRRDALSKVESADEWSSLTMPKTVWNMPYHNAGKQGSDLIKKIIGPGRFTFPKSLYAVQDTLNIFLCSKPQATVLDFFAGSGTTLHAVNILNTIDGGKRRCILVTNNEVSAEEAKKLSNNGYKPGEDEWEQYGVARYVTWPRTVCSIKGCDINEDSLKGDYIGSDIPMADGFAANAAFFKLGFLDKNSVALGRQFRELLPVLWMKAGAVGPCPKLETEDLPAWLILPQNKLAVLIDDNQYYAFKQEMEKTPGIETLFIITDFEREYAIMADELGIPNTFQLYRDYLDNFRINHSR